MKKRHQQKLVVLSIVLLCLFNIPVLLLFDNTATTIAGFPLIYFYIFSVWAVSIIISFIILKKFYE